MELKKREKSSFLSYISHNFSGLLKKISNKRTKIAYKILKIFLILLIGIILGLLFAKFFGTLDNPSRTALNFLNLDGLRDEKFVVDGILAENIRIPFNWVIGQFSTKEKIYIDIDFENYNKLEYKRQQALELGVLLTSAEDYVPAKITHNNEEYNVKLRLKGDHLDHLETSKWSFRVKVKDDKSLFGMTVFSLQNPRTRIYINELIYLLTLKESGLISLRYDFVEIFINGENKGIYALEEHFAKELIENNNRRDGILLKFSEDLVWEEYAMRPSLPSGLHFDTLFQSSVIETFDNDEILEDPIKANQFNTAKNLLESFRLNQLKTHQVFDVESFADYFAIVTLLNAGHAIEVQNMRFYYNPITSLLEPIGFDGYVNPSNAQAAMLNYLPECVVLSQIDNKCSPKNNDFIELFFSDEIFLKAYIQSLNDISDPSYLDDLFKKINPELKKEMRIMYKDYPFTHIPEENIYRNQAQIKDMLNPVQALNAHLLEGISSDNKVVLSLGNINTLPLEIVSLDINGTIISLNSRKILQPWNIDGEVKYKQIEFYIPSGIQWKSEYSSELKLNYRIFGLEEIKSAPIVPWENFENNFVQEDFMLQTSNFSSFEMLEVNEDVKTISIKKGTWQIQEDLIIPTGYRLVAEGETNIDLINNAMILSHSRITFEGSLEKPIRIFSSDGTGQGISVLNSEFSLLKYVYFENIKSPSKQGWSLSGAINFYKTPTHIYNSKFSNLNAEDGLNIIDSEFKIKDSSFENCFSDCFDDDFSNGNIIDSSFTSCGNDCIDISDAFVNMTNVGIIGAGDKGVSVGENSTSIIDNSIISGSLIGLASKDLSDVFMNDVEIFDSLYGITAYQKKSEYGPSTINASLVTFSNVENNYLVEKNSELKLNGTIILGYLENIYEILYGEGE